MTSLKHLSYSSISSYLMCPKSWRLHYIDKVPTMTAAPLLFGSAFHDATERYIADSSATLANCWEGAWAKQSGRKQEVNWGDETPKEVYDEGLRILGTGKVADKLNDLRARMGPEPIVERRVNLKVPGVPIPIMGYIDVITADGIPGDIKTSARSWGAGKAESETQSLFYLAALNQMGQPSPDNTFRHFVFTKNSRPTAQEFEHRHSDGEILWLFELIQQVWRAIEAEAFPANPTGWKCSPKYCDYWSECRGRYV